MAWTGRPVIGIAVGFVVGIAVALFLNVSSTVVAGTGETLPIDFKIGSRVQVLGWNGTLDIAEIQGGWLRGTYGKDETIWVYAPAAQGFVFKTPHAAK
jgi:hypothetical protein